MPGGALDLYRKAPRDLTESTLSGAAVSVVTVITALILFFSEWRLYSSVKRETEMKIDGSLGTAAKMQINLDITFPKLPCEVVGLDATDAMGSHEVDIHGNMFKDRQSKAGEYLGREEMKGTALSSFASLSRHHAFQRDDTSTAKIKEALANGEGCRVWGFVRVNRVPGNIHIDTHSYNHMFGSFFSDWSSMDVSHRVNHLSFGDDADVLHVKQRFPDTGIIRPLDGVVHDAPTPQRDLFDSSIFEYYVKVVPTTYVDLNGNTSSVFQFTAASNLVKSAQMPSLYIRYDVSAVSVIYKETKRSFVEFFVSVCAIVGGLFTVAGIFDGLLHAGVLAIAKKAQLGKLG